MWAIHKYKEVTEFTKKLRVCDMYVISQEDLITYESLVQEATREYRNLVDSKRWEPATSKEKSPDQPSHPNAYTVAILPVKYPCTLTIIAIGAPLVLVVVAVHGGCCRIFGI